MRKLLMIGVCLGFLLSGFNTQASEVVRRDPGDAFPWGAEMPFPWKGIQGTWMANINGQTNYFSFQVVKYNDGVNQLQVKQFTGNCEFESHGAGYEQNRVVRAMMVGEYGAFNLTVHVFRHADLKQTDEQGKLMDRTGRTVTVMKISPMSNTTEKGAERRTYQLIKMSKDPCGICP